MKFNFLKEFVILVEILDLTRTSHKLHLTHPVLSWHIKEFETLFGGFVTTIKYN